MVAQLPTFAVLTFVGPGEVEFRRLQEMLESLVFFEPNVRTIVLIDDRSGHAFESVVPHRLVSRTHVLPNPRNGRGDWWQGGLCVGLTEGLRWLATNRTCDFVVRMDTDALVIGEFASRVDAAFRENPEAGLLGTWDKYPMRGRDRLPHPDMSEVLPSILEKAARHLAVWRHSQWRTRLQCSLLKRDRIVRAVIRGAIRNGYRPGDFLQGGAYAIRGEMLPVLLRQNLLNHPLAFLHQFYSEDVLATLLCYAASYVPVGFNQPGDVFGVQYQDLPAKPVELVDAEYAIVHSLKSKSGKEEEWLAAFKTLRGKSQLHLRKQPRTT